MNQEILQHMQSRFGPVRSLGEFKPDIGVALYAAGPSAGIVTVFTVGLSDFTMIVPEGQEQYRHAEVLMRLPADWPLQRADFHDHANLWPLEWLRNMARFPRENNTWLGGPSTIVANGEPPEPLGPNTAQSCLLLVEDGHIAMGDGRRVVLYAMTPLYAEEKALEEKTSLRQLLERFNEKNVSNVVSLRRANAAL